MEWNLLFEAAAPEGESADHGQVLAALDHLLDRLAIYGGSVGGDSRTWSARFDLEASTALEAATAGERLLQADVARFGLPAWSIIRVECVAGAVLDNELEQPSLPEMVGTQEVTTMLGISRQRLHELRGAGRFPEPVLQLSGTPIWLSAAIEAFESGWDRRPGRRRDSTTATTV